MAYGPKVRSAGSASYPLTAHGAHIFKRDYFKSKATTGDVRGEYQDLYFDKGGGGETLRIRGIANGTLVAAGGTINAIHATGRVASGKTVSGALNAIRATLEVAGTTPTPGGCVSVLQLDTAISTGWTDGVGLNTSSFIRVTNSGAGIVTQLLSLPALGTGLLVSAHTSQTNTHSIKILVNGVQYYIPIHATATGLS